MAVKEPKTPAKREPDYIDKPSPFSIEGIRSGAVTSRVVKVMIVLSGLIMAGTFAVSSLSPTGVPQNNPNGTAQNPTETVATVGDQTVTAGQLNNTFARTVDMNMRYGFGSKPTADNYLSQKQDALKRLTDNAALIVAAQKADITVSDSDIDKELDKEIRDSLKPQGGQSEAAFMRFIQTQYKVGTIDEAVEIDKGKVTQEGRDGVQKKLLVDKLEKQTKDGATSTEEDYKRSITKLDLYQIVIRPDLPKGTVKDFKAEQTRLQGVAQDKATKLFAQLKANPTLANFKAVALKQSADTVTKPKGGSLGLKLPAEIQPPDVGEALSKSAQALNGPFKSEGDGSQTIYFVAARKTDLPKDYAKTKKKLLADFETQQDNMVWQKKQEELQKAVTPDVSDPAMAAYQLQTKDLYTKTGDDQKKMRDDILERYDEALKTAGKGLEAAAINFQKSTLYRDAGQKQPQLEALKAATENDKNDAGLLVAYGQALSDGGQPKPALEQFKAASKALDNNPSTPSPFGGGNPDDALRQQLAAQFDFLKQPALAKAERAKIKPAAPGGMGGLNFGGLPPGVKISPGPAH
ncbi:hypothetical protein IAD21_03176 [Abditibacteriota bacterium]|nr:hypothetical protein IAD21_03176 [Abditibacteriota bacterium]